MAGDSAVPPHRGIQTTHLFLFGPLVMLRIMSAASGFPLSTEKLEEEIFDP